MAEITRRIGYRKSVDGEYEPFLILEPKVPQWGRTCNFAVPLDELWRFTPDKNPDFTTHKKWVTEKVCKDFNLGDCNSRRQAEIMTVIEDGIDELLKAPPEPPYGRSIRDAFKIAIEKAELEGNRMRVEATVHG